MFCRLPQARWGALTFAVALANCGVGVAGCGRMGFELTPAISTPDGTDVRDGGAYDAREPDLISGLDVSLAADAPGGPPDGPNELDGAGTDTTSAGQADGPPPSLLLFQDFEAEPAAWNRIWVNSGGAVSRSGTLAYSGTGAMSVVTSDRGGGGMFERVVEPPLQDGQLFMRAFLYIPSNQRIRSWIVLMEAKNSNTSEKVSFDIYSMNFGASIHGSGSFLLTSPVFDRWFCVEIAVDVHATRGSVRMFVDGQQLIERLNINTILGSGANFYRVGTVTSEEQRDRFEMYADDFVVSRNRIGCGL